MAIKVESAVECIEVDGKEPGVSAHPRPMLLVRSHWQHPRRVVLELSDRSVTVEGSELLAAVHNALNRGGPI